MLEHFDELELLELLNELSLRDEEGNLIFNFTSNHLLVCMILGKKNKKAATYFYDKRTGFSREHIKELEDNGYIIRIKPYENTLENFVIHGDIIDRLIITEDHFDEFWNLYPKFMDINGKLVPCRNTDYDKLKERYIKITKKNRKMHDLIISATKIYIKMVNKGTTTPMGIDKFIGGRNYESYIELLETEDPHADDDNFRRI